MSRVTAIIIAVAACIILSLCWAVNHYRDNAITFKDQRDKATAKSQSAESITTNVIRMVSIMNTITEANNNAKHQITLESQNVANDIKEAVANDDCARRPVPAAVADRLREYADSLRSGSGGTSSGKPYF